MSRANHESADAVIGRDIKVFKVSRNHETDPSGTMVPLQRQKLSG